MSDEESSEQALLVAAIAGDSSAVEQLLFAYFTPLEEYLNRKLPDRASPHFGVEDILQITFAEVFRDIGQFKPRGEGAFFAWVRTIADHRLIDALRKIDRGRHKEISIGHLGNSESLIELVGSISRMVDSPSRQVRSQEAIRAIQIAIGGLPDDQREAIQLHCLEGKTLEEIARETGKTHTLVRGIVRRGKRNLALAMVRSSKWLSSR